MNLLPFIKTLNLMLRFSLELFALGSLAYWGFQTGKGSMRVLLSIGAPLIIAVFWGIFGSPRSYVQLSTPIHILLELLIFGLPSVALYTSGKHSLALIYITIAIINRILMYMWQQQRH
ncbi:YrdB family protein [Priestia megaterium]|uniref:YrdB family protein n=1 Tax=Priestia megaterium TaxID=1404 RepID=UPI001C235743|nr:YrdB family protein [Priestia megaterium]MBU8589180.1 YrdB family protein [Priestia megaterium]